MLNVVHLQKLTPSLQRIMELKEREIATKVGFLTKQRMFRAQIILEP